jgi:hypothetical protein
VLKLEDFNAGDPVLGRLLHTTAQAPERSAKAHPRTAEDIRIRLSRHLCLSIQANQCSKLTA